MSTILKCFLVLIGLILIHALPGQSNSKKQDNIFGFSVLAGLNTTQVDGDFVKGYKKNGFYAGLSGLIHLSPRSKIEIGLIYSEKGSQWGNEENGFKTNSATILNMNMVEVPITFKYYSKVEGSSIYWEGGIAIAQLINRSLDEDFPSRLAPEIYAEMDPFFKKQELNIVFGLGVRIETILQVGLRFTSALGHIMDKNLPPIGTTLISDRREIGILRNYGFALLISRDF